MRILLVSAALLGAASCAAPPPLQQGANCPYARHALAAARAPAVAVAPAPPPVTAPTPLVAAPPAVAAPPPPSPTAPPPAAAVPARPVAAVPPPAPVAAVYVPYLNPQTVVRGALHKVFGPLVPLAPEQGRLTLSNYSYRLADVEAIVTRYPDCAVHPGMVPLGFKLRFNSTWVIRTPAGSDVCWRRQLVPQQAAAPGATPGWTDWSRDYTAYGRFIDSEL